MTPGRGIAQVYADRAGKWRWRVKARNGRIVADSGESFPTRYHADRALRRMVHTTRGILVVLGTQNAGVVLWPESS